MWECALQKYITHNYFTLAEHVFLLGKCVNVQIRFACSPNLFRIGHNWAYFKVCPFARSLCLSWYWRNINEICVPPAIWCDIRWWIQNFVISFNSDHLAFVHSKTINDFIRNYKNNTNQHNITIDSSIPLVHLVVEWNTRNTERCPYAGIYQYFG